MNGPTRATMLMIMLAGAHAVWASGINGINNGMPNRISMNVTVPRQTQGATFGERVNSGLQATGSVVANGASLVIECGSTACAVALPNGSGYRVELKSMTLAPLDMAQGQSLRKAMGQSSVLGGALPGGAIISAAVSSVGNLAGGGSGAAAASYAATGRSAANRELVSRVREDGAIEVTDPLVDGVYALTLVVEKPGNGSKDTLQTQVRMAAPVRVRIRLVFSVADGVLRAQQDSSGNSIAALQ